MAQSFSKMYVHLIFSTKDRERTLPDEIRPDLHAYLGGTFKGLGCSPVEINTEPDHLHALFLLTRTKALSDVVGHVKKSSNDWLRSQGPQFAGFFWQAGFGAFSVSQSQVEDVRTYIRNQREHHRVKSFQDEFLAFLKAYEVEFDQRYVWTEKFSRPFRPPVLMDFLPQGIGLRPQPWAGLCRPVGPGLLEALRG